CCWWPRCRGTQWRSIRRIDAGDTGSLVGRHAMHAPRRPTMRAIRCTVSALCLAAFSIAGCSASAPEEPLGTRQSALQGGAVDTVDRGVVGLLVQRAAGRQTCSGTLIASNVVVTARHCISEAPPDTVRCGHAPLGAAVLPGAIDVTTT